MYNVANFSKPGPGQPALISSDDVNAMFHEFGHALHGLFQHVAYPSLSAGARDWVEFPSQFNEHWALDPKVLGNYAFHYKTGAPMPAALVEKIKRTPTFNQGYDLGELIAAAELDMLWDKLPPTAPLQDPDQFEGTALAGMGSTSPTSRRATGRAISSTFGRAATRPDIAAICGRRCPTTIPTPGWKLTAASPAPTASVYSDLILPRGHSEDYNTMFRAFYGKDADIDPMLEDHGLRPH